MTVNLSVKITTSERNVSFEANGVDNATAFEMLRVALFPQREEITFESYGPNLEIGDEMAGDPGEEAAVSVEGVQPNMLELNEDGKLHEWSPATPLTSNVEEEVHVAEERSIEKGTHVKVLTKCPECDSEHHANGRIGFPVYCKTCNTPLFIKNKGEGVFIASSEFIPGAKRM